MAGRPVSAKPVRRADGTWSVPFSSNRIPAEYGQVRFPDQARASEYARAVADAVNASRPLPALHAWNGQATRPRGPFNDDELRRTPLTRLVEVWIDHKNRSRAFQLKREEAIRRNLAKHALPYLQILGVGHAQDLEPWHIPELALALAGRPNHGPDAVAPDEPDWTRPGTERLTVQQIVELSNSTDELVSVDERTVREAITRGRLPPAARGSAGEIFLRKEVFRARVLTTVKKRTGLNHGTAGDILRSLHAALELARALGIVDAPDIPKRLWAPVKPDGKDQVRGPRLTNPPVSLPQLHQVAASMPILHQVTLWFLALLGVRFGEAFGFRVHDWFDATDPRWSQPRQAGVGGLLYLDRQGGQNMEYRDDYTAETVNGTEGPPKNTQSVRAIVVPDQLADLIRLVIEVFHTREDGSIDQGAPLIPLVGCESGAQMTFRSALTTSLRRLKLPHMTPKDMRARLVSSLHDRGIPETALRRLLGHELGSDVLRRHYISDTDELHTPMRVAALTSTMLHERGIVNLAVPTTARHQFHGPDVDSELWIRRSEVLTDLGWHISSAVDPTALTVAQLAARVGAAPSSLRRAIANGDINATRQPDGQRGYTVPEDEARRLEQRQGTHARLPELADELGINYTQMWKLVTDLPGVGRCGNVRTVTPDAEQDIRQIVREWKAVQERSVSVREVAALLACDQRQARVKLNRARIPSDHEDPRRYDRAAFERWHVRTTARPVRIAIRRVG
jgi:hypothetical protein